MWAIIENARTFFERNACGVSQNPKPLGRGGQERGLGKNAGGFRNFFFGGAHIFNFAIPYKQPATTYPNSKNPGPLKTFF